jgi:putative transposase
MITMIFAFVSLLSFRFRSRAGLELELVALRHQVAVLRRQRKGRIQLFSTDRLLWVWLYRIWPQALDAMVLVKPTTVVHWHRLADFAKLVELFDQHSVSFVSVT